MTTKEMLQSPRSENGISRAALTMALAILVERVATLPKEDRDDFFELTKEIPNTEYGEDHESIVTTMLEILEPPRSGITQMTDPLREPQPGSGLQKWIDYVSKRIRKLRKQAGFTQKQLAKKSGLPQSHISRLESGKHSPSRMTLEKIAAAVGVAIGDLDPGA